MGAVDNDRKILNVVLVLSLLISPVLGILVADAPNSVSGLEAIYGKALQGLGWGIGFGATFAVCWILVQIVKTRL